MTDGIRFMDMEKNGPYHGFNHAQVELGVASRCLSVNSFPKFDAIAKSPAEFFPLSLWERAG